MINVKTLPGYVQNFIDPSAVLADGAFVWWFAVILAGCRLGKRVMIGSRTELGFRCIIGDDTRIGSGVFLPPDSKIGERVFIGPNVTFTDDKLPKVNLPGDPPYSAQPPVIEDDAAIGAGAVILPGVTIGRGARVAAGAVVTSDVEPFSIVMGLPAREIALAGDREHPWLGKAD